MSTILIIDDEPVACGTLARVLRREGFDTIAAHGGMAALELLAVRTPDLILLDVRMPDLDGLELLEILQAEPRWKSLPVIMMTGVSDTNCIRRAHQLGAKAYLVKATYSLGEMLDAVKQYTELVPH